MSWSTHFLVSWRVVALVSVLVMAVSGLANCPSGCQCDDNTLIVQCGQGQLDVLPIALNPSIQRLVIKSNKIKTIDSSIQFYAELTFLDLSSNHLMTIPQRTFAYQRKLQEVHLSYNKIGQVNNKTFIGLSAVTVLNLRGNLILEIHQDTFKPLQKIEELNLGENRIHFIDPKAFDGLTQLRILYLDDNALTSVPDPVIFQAMPSLAELFLGMNTLLTIPSAAFQNVNGLTRLDLKGAGLRNISHDSFKGLEAIRVLDLSDNRLARIPTLALSKLVRLEELSLGQNDFEVIMEGAFVGLKQLKRLDISGAIRLKRVMNGAFSPNTNMEWLNLSTNKMLAEVQEGALSGLPHLKHVILKANALTTMAEGLFPWKDLTTLDLSDNPIACDCRVMWLRNLLITLNATNSDAMTDVICEFPERLRGEALKNLNPTLMGCSHSDPRKQALIGALLVGSAATITALALIIYRCRRKIREYLKGSLWGNSALGRKEREYQKTFCDEDYMTRHQHHPCSLGIHSSFSNTYTPHRSNAPAHYGMCTMQIGDLSVNDTQNFQQLQVPTHASLMHEKKNLKAPTGPNIDDSTSFVMNIKSNTFHQNFLATGTGMGPTQKLNHYTKPQFLTPNAAVGDSCYSYADVPMLHTNLGRTQPPRQQQERLTQDHFKILQTDTQTARFHYESSQGYAADSGSDITDPNYIYSNTHYSMPLEQAGRVKTPIPPALPPALPLRNGASTTERTSFKASNKSKTKNSSTESNNKNTIRNYQH